MKNQMNNISLNKGELAILTDGTIIMNTNTFIDMINDIRDGMIRYNDEVENQFDSDEDFGDNDVYCIHPEDWEEEKYDEEEYDEEEYDEEYDNTDEENDEYDWGDEDDWNAEFERMDNEISDMNNEIESYEDEDENTEDIEDEKFYIDQVTIDALLRNIIQNPKTNLQKEIKKEMTNPSSHIGELLRTILC